MPFHNLKDEDRCTAKAKRSGQRCTNPAMRGRPTCDKHGSKSNGPRTRKDANGKVRAVGVFKRAILELPPEQQEIVKAYLDAEGDTLQSIRRQNVNVLAAWQAQSLRSLAIGKQSYEWLEQTLRTGVNQVHISQRDSELILERCHGPEPDDLSKMSRVMFQGIKDAETNPFEIMAYSLIQGIMQSETLEELQDFVRREFVDKSIENLVESAYT